MAYFIYGKTKEMSKFRPIDLKNGTFCNNVIYASMWFDNQKEVAYKVKEEIARKNPDCVFEVRKKG